jgi:hypothetical protein
MRQERYLLPTMSPSCCKIGSVAFDNRFSDDDGGDDDGSYLLVQRFKYCVIEVTTVARK